MSIRLSVKVSSALAGMALSIAAVPAAAEQLLFDQRLSAPLAAAFASNDPGRIAYNAANPKYVTDVIAVRGASARDWSEAMVIISRALEGKVRTARDWVAELQAEATSRCSSTFTTIAEDAASVTFERRSTGCPVKYPPFAIYRAIAGQRSLFLLAAMTRDGMNDDARREWHAVLASAHIK